MLRLVKTGVPFSSHVPRCLSTRIPMYKPPGVSEGKKVCANRDSNPGIFLVHDLMGKKESKPLTYSRCFSGVPLRWDEGVGILAHIRAFPALPSPWRISGRGGSNAAELDGRSACRGGQERWGRKGTWEERWGGGGGLESVRERMGLRSTSSWGDGPIQTDNVIGDCGGIGAGQ